MPSAGGGTIVTGAASESVALTDGQTVLSVYEVARSETVALTDSQNTSANTFNAANSESVALTDSQSAGPSTYAVTKAESVALTDSQTGAVTAAGVNTVTDSISVVDSEVARAIFAVGRAESFTLTDSQDATATGIKTGTVNESITLTATQTGTLPGSVTGLVNESFTLTDSQRGTVDSGLCPGLPPGWVMVKVLESVPNPNFGTPYGTTYFTRWTYITYDELGNFVCASGADTDCCSQAHAMAQQRTQQQPYDQAI